jgi:DNA-binding transcriptional LysR family regulator
MQLEALQVFCDVARYRSFSQAGAANHVSQSAASQIVLQLERRLGVQLIDRSTRPLQLTPLGKAYYDGCKRMLDQYLELEASIRRDQTLLVPTVEVAAIYSVGLGDMGQYVDRFAQLLPQAKVHIQYLHPNRVYEMVLEGSADFGLVSFPRKSRDLTALPWRDEPMVVVCPANHPLARLKSVRPDQLNDIAYVGFDRDLVIRREVDRFLRAQRVNVRVGLEFDNIENIKKAIEIGAGVALLPEPTLGREVQTGSLVAVPLAGRRLVRPLGIVHRRQAALSMATLAFIDVLRQTNGSAPAGNQAGGALASGTDPSPNGSHAGRPALSRAQARKL